MLFANKLATAWLITARGCFVQNNFPAFGQCYFEIPHCIHMKESLKMSCCCLLKVRVLDSCFSHCSSFVVGSTFLVCFLVLIAFVSVFKVDEFYEEL